MRKQFFKLMIIATMAIGAVSAWANGTKSGTIISNTVVAKYSNVGMTAYKVFNTTNAKAVAQTFGLNMQFVPSHTNNTAQAGQYVTYLLYVTNKGNNTVTLKLTNNYFDSSTAGWSYGFYNNPTKTGPLQTNIQIAEDNFTTLYFTVTAPAGANDQDSATNTFLSMISNNWKAIFTRMSNYQGMQDYKVTNYGGLASFQNLAITIVSAPSLKISKSAFITNSPSFQLLGPTATARTQAVPGSLIVFAIQWTNKGSGTLKNFSFQDVIPAAYRWDANSLYYTNGAYLNASYVNYLATSNGGAGRHFVDATQATNSAITSPGNWGIGMSSHPNNGTLNIVYTNTIPSHSKGTIFYKAFVR